MGDVGGWEGFRRGRKGGSEEGWQSLGSGRGQAAQCPSDHVPVRLWLNGCVAGAVRASEKVRARRGRRERNAVGGRARERELGKERRGDHQHPHRHGYSLANGGKEVDFSGSHSIRAHSCPAAGKGMFSCIPDAGVMGYGEWGRLGEGKKWEDLRDCGFGDVNWLPYAWMTY